MKTLNVVGLNAEYAEKSAAEIIKFVLEEIGLSKITLASSLSIEDQVLTDMILKANPKARIFFIDTGRHFQKTYDLMEQTMRKYNFNYELYAPESLEIETMVSQDGPNSFYKSIDLRKNVVKLGKFIH